MNEDRTIRPTEERSSVAVSNRAAAALRRLARSLLPSIGGTRDLSKALVAKLDQTTVAAYVPAVAFSAACVLSLATSGRAMPDLVWHGLMTPAAALSASFGLALSRPPQGLVLNPAPYTTYIPKHVEPSVWPPLSADTPFKET